jgi:hypothetical protein
MMSYQMALKYKRMLLLGRIEMGRHGATMRLKQWYHAETKFIHYHVQCEPHLYTVFVAW